MIRPLSASVLSRQKLPGVSFFYHPTLAYSHHLLPQTYQLLPERLETLGGGVPHLFRTFGKFLEIPLAANSADPRISSFLCSPIIAFDIRLFIAILPRYAGARLLIDAPR